MSETNGDLDFSDLAPREVQVPIGTEVYTLRPASANSVIAFRARCAKAAHYGADGKVSRWEGLADTEPYLVSQCLHGPKGLVSETQIRQWPNRVLKGLFKKAFEISDIEDKADPTRDQLVAALSREDSPVKLADLRTWLAALEPRGDYEAAVAFLRTGESQEARVKN